jgi:hypothetical protein
LQKYTQNGSDLNTGGKTTKLLSDLDLQLNTDVEHAKKKKPKGK